MTHGAVDAVRKLTTSYGLPIFHSFGLTAGILIPLLGAGKVDYLRLKDMAAGT